MKTWIAKYRMLLDRPSARRTSSSGAAGGKLEQFEQRHAALDYALRGGPPCPEPPPGLHGSIMAAVRASASAPAPVNFWAPRWILAAAGACLVFFSVWNAAHLLRSRPAPSPFTASASMKLNRQVAELPSVMLSPLSDEWKALNIDLHRTADFLLASIP